MQHNVHDMLLLEAQGNNTYVGLELGGYLTEIYGTNSILRKTRN